MFGTVVSVNPRGFGFVRPNGEAREIFFHAYELQGMDFDAQLVGERVDFDEQDTDRGVRAFRVRPVAFN